MLNDDSNEVGRVHFGLIHVLVLNEPRVASNEQAIGDLKFLSKEQLSNSIAEYENWSQICIGQLPLLLASDIEHIEQDDHA
jgi:predicted NUDIX family phosphoesterase